MNHENECEIGNTEGDLLRYRSDRKHRQCLYVVQLYFMTLRVDIV